MTLPPIAAMSMFEPGLALPLYFASLLYAQAAKPTPTKKAISHADI